MNTHLDGLHGEIISVAFSPNNKKLAVGRENRSITLYGLPDDHSSKEMLSDPNKIFIKDAIFKSNIAFSPDSETIATGAPDWSIKIYSAHNGTTVKEFKEPNTVCAVAFSSDGETLVNGCEDRWIRVRSLLTGYILKEINTIPGRWIDNICLNAANTIITNGAALEGLVRRWDIQTGQELESLKGHSGILRCTAYKKGTNVLASGGYDKTLRLWNTEKGELMHTFQHDNFVYSVAFNDVNDLLAGVDGNKIKIWNSTSHNLVRELSTKTEAEINTIAFSNDGALLASGSKDGHLEIFKINP